MKPYSRYKPTGLAWLPSIPEHWEVVKNRSFLHESCVLLPETKAQLLSVSQYDGVTPFPEDRKERVETLEGYKVVDKNDLVMNIMLAWNGSSGVSAHQGVVSPAYAVFKILDGANPRFIHYLFRSDCICDYFKAFSTGVVDSRLRLYPQVLARMWSPLPPPSEQDRIVRYLDEKTAAIDELVRAKERQIELLRERKQALVSAAVTGGLDPATERKDSGVPWIGKIPKGWEVCRLKRLAKLKGGVGFPIEFQGHRNEAIPFIKVNALASRIDPSMNFDTISEETLEKLHATAFKQGSIVFAKVGAALLLRRFEFLPFDCCIDNNMMAIYDISQDRFWLRYALSLLDFGLLVNPGAVPSVNQNQIGNLLLPVPPLPEQRRIVAHLDSACSELDAAEVAIRKQISLLQELRTRLVSDAVTGAVEVG